MTREEHLKFCTTCKLREPDFKRGLLCSLTGEYADFEGECSDFKIDESIVRNKQREAELKPDEEEYIAPDDPILEKVRVYQNPSFALIGGVALSFICAWLWAALTIATEYQLSLVAIGVGLVVGFGVRFFGAGIDQVYRIIGAVCALLGCVLGNLFSQIGFIAQEESMSYLEVFSFLNPEVVMMLMSESFAPMDLLFYALAGAEGYKFSVRPITKSMVASGVYVPEANNLRGPFAIATLLALGGISFFLSQDVESEIVDYHPNGEVLVKGPTLNGHSHGLWVYFYETGDTAAYGMFENGYEEGDWTWLYESGATAEVGHYANGLEDGVWTTFFESGQISEQLNFKAGRKEGILKSFDEAGNLLVEGNFKHDAEDGLALYYYSNGLISDSGAFHEGQRIGQWSYYTESGNPIEFVEYDSSGSITIHQHFDTMGKPVLKNGSGIITNYHAFGIPSEEIKLTAGKPTQTTYYYPSGDVQMIIDYHGDTSLIKELFDTTGYRLINDGLGEYKNYVFIDSEPFISERGYVEKGMREGTWYTYYPGTNSIALQCEYQDGSMHGAFKQLDEAGELSVEGAMRDNEREGEWVWYHSPGTINSSVTYENGKKEGIQLFYTESGYLAKQEHYQNGVLIKSELIQE